MHTEQVPVKLLLTVIEAAQVLNLSRSLMYELVLTGQVVSLKIGRARRIPASELQAYIARQVAGVQQGEGV
jgi:excisionase family DNA binding protein